MFWTNVKMCKNVKKWSDTSTLSTESLGETGIDIQDSFKDSSVELGKERDDDQMR